MQPQTIDCKRAAVKPRCRTVQKMFAARLTELPCSAFCSQTRKTYVIVTNVLNFEVRDR